MKKDMKTLETEKEKFLAKLKIELEEAEEDIKNNRVYDAREVFEELDRKYGYKI